MANCRQCGAELPSFTFGEASSFCKTCQSQLAAEIQPQKVDSLPVQSSLANKATPATFALLGINIAVFIAMVALGVSIFEPETQQVLHWGADYGPYTLGGQYWRLITSMFVHFGIIHIFGNMWCLWSLGRLAERLLGSLSVIVATTELVPVSMRVTVPTSGLPPQMAPGVVASPARKRPTLTVARIACVGSTTLTGGVVGPIAAGSTR